MGILSSLINPTAQIDSNFAGGSAIVNPGAGAVLADTGQLVAGRYYFQFIMDATVATRFSRQHRNAANSANVANSLTKEIPIPLDTEIDTIYSIWVDVLINERIRVIDVAGFTGSATALIAFGRVL